MNPRNSLVLDGGWLFLGVILEANAPLDQGRRPTVQNGVRHPLPAAAVSSSGSERPHSSCDQPQHPACHARLCSRASQIRSRHNRCWLIDWDPE